MRSAGGIGDPTDQVPELAEIVAIAVWTLGVFAAGAAWMRHRAAARLGAESERRIRAQSDAEAAQRTKVSSYGSTSIASFPMIFTAIRRACARCS